MLTIHTRTIALLCAVVTTVIFTSTIVKGAALPYAYVEVNSFPELAKATGIAAVKPINGESSWQMAAVRDGRVLLYEVSDRTTAAYQELGGFPSSAVSIAFADYDGDKQDDIWIGSGGSGNVYVYGLGEGYPFLGKSTDRTWSPIVQLLTPDLDGDSFADAVLLTEAGSVVVMLRRDTGFAKVWSSGGREGKVQRLLVHDLNKDGQSEVVLARDGYAAVWHWVANQDDAAVKEFDTTEIVGALPAPRLGYAATFTIEVPSLGKHPSNREGRFTQIWERDSFQGLIQGAVAGDLNHDGTEELLLTTSQNQIYVVIATQPDRLACIANEDLSFAAGLRSTISSDDTMLFGTQGDYLTMWKHKGGTTWQFEQVWQSEFDLKFSRMIPAGDRLIFLTTEGVKFYKKVPRNFIRVVVQGSPYDTLLADPLVVRGDVLLSSKDWANLLELPTPAWHPAGRVTLMQGLQYMIATLGSKELLTNGRTITLRNEPRNLGGLVFLPAEAINSFRGGITWYPRTRILSIR